MDSAEAEVKQIDGVVDDGNAKLREPEIYGRRFSSSEESARAITWEILCREFFPKFISPTDTVVDIGAGDGHFLRNIQAKRRIAVDISPHVLALEAEGIEVVQSPADELARVLPRVADKVFMSNFLEHLPNKHLVLEVIDQCRKILKPGGKILILQPNIRFLGAKYWDYIDHHVALTEASLVEALEVCGFRVDTLYPRFLPYTAKSALSNFASLTSVYLRFPLLWKIFGKQTFVVAEPVNDKR